MAGQRSSLVWTLALFFFSGATSLVYEVLWTRRLSLTFGHTVMAVSTVLTVFMSGLALGSFLAGRWSDKERKRLQVTGDPRGAARFLAVYGFLELFIGAWAILSLALLNGVEHIYLGAARDGMEGAWLHGLVFLGSFLVLLPPTAAMGATLPAFTQMLVVSRLDVGTWLSRIYGWNTLGACCGAALGGFVLLPLLGLKLSVASAAAANLAIGVVALVGAHRLRGLPVTALESDEPDQGQQNKGGMLLPLAFGISGFAAMIYQLGWTRGLILSIGSSTYSFAIILTAFLASLGLGSLIYRKGMGKRAPRIWHLAVLQLTIGLSGLLATHGLGLLPTVMVRAIPALGHDFLKVMIFDFVLALMLMFVPTLAMGLTFPLVTHLYTDRISSLGRRLGEAYAANTCGAIVGSFLAGFVLVPTFGAQKALLGAVVVNLLVGLVLAIADRGSKKQLVSLGAVAVTGLVLVGLTPAWDPGRLTAGAGIYAQAENFLFKPAYYKDGVSATVSVGFNGSHSPYLKVNGKTDASLALADMCQQILNGLVPAALHPNPRRVAVIGLGSGVTAATLLALDSVETLSCAELEPAVVEIQSFFGPYNDHLLKHPKLDLQINDGRTFILGSPGNFDMIVSEPSNPWIAGIGNLYTEDFYRACARRLNPGGMMCQWVNSYAVSQSDLQLVLSTFFSAYPHGAIFQVGPGDIMLVGKMDPLRIDPTRLSALWAESDVAGWLQMIGLLKPDYFYGTWIADREQVVAKLNGWQDGKPTLPLNTDDRPLLEFQAPLSLYFDDPTVVEFLQSFPDLVPAQFSADPRAQMGALFGRLQLGRLSGLAPRISQAMASDYPLAPLAEAIMLERSGKLAEAEGLLRAIAPDQARLPEAQILLGDLRSAAEQWQTALIHYQLALEDPLPGSAYTVAMKAGECAARADDFDLALQLFQTAAQLSQRPDGLYKSGEVRLGQGDPEAAAVLFSQALQRDPHDYASQHRLAAIAFDRGDVDEAYRLALASYQNFPELRQNVELLVALSARAGQAKEAARYQTEVNSLRQREADQRLKAGP